MKIDCRNLACPRPVIETKQAIEKLQVGDSLEIFLNSEVSKNNVLKFLNSLNLETTLIQKGEEFIIQTIKKEMKNLNLNPDDFSCDNNDTRQKNVLFLKTLKVGEGELGENLFVGFLNTLKNLENPPYKILCVNESVLLNCDEEHKAYAAMKELEKMGIEIISCGACLEYFGKSKELKIGTIGNAYEILSELFGKAKIITL
ncbi:sulfurtransferase-like selenium metabolism protein YedF [Campylobacter sp. US33a]|uniref:Sulfurtransferase-like selenium metabolism protein YedF n=1 Tax=Campylobacter sp. CCS1377 TaxID=3158229 RepID=A0AAU7E7M4_9BACT|nr:sulfurtransferase-like selenium metabolism protein YedF [Campylobacter sp. US33a]MCW1360362.1 sulfurtransferase-like selenium metabolism protein YedF [Campylobacter jejuni]TEY04464.1 sulfurtransferase-like selenium metabolism protein YedF [Campylobacter sp. US33a]